MNVGEECVVEVGGGAQGRVFALSDVTLRILVPTTVLLVNWIFVTLLKLFFDWPLLEFTTRKKAFLNDLSLVFNILIKVYEPVLFLFSNYQKNLLKLH